MSEAERKKRQEYKQNRKKWIIIQIIAIALISVITIASFAVFNTMNRTYYINYNEAGRIDYSVALKENDFFEENKLGPNQAYIASLIDNIAADFVYELKMDAENISFDYSYSIDANLRITDGDSGAALLDRSYSLVPEKKASVSKGNFVIINERINIDYAEYNDHANDFINTYDLKSATSALEVKLNVDVLSRCDEFDGNNSNKYSVSLNIPLVKHTFSMKTSTSAPAGESKVLACSSAINQNIFKVIGIVGICVDVLLAGAFIAFIYLTRNEDINYTIKVQRLVSAYRSYIQQIEGDFDISGQRVVVIKTFSELLGIRDTLQSPILMSENEDKTHTRFIIPSAELLYMFEIKVDNFDEIYGEGSAK